MLLFHLIYEQVGEIGLVFLLAIHLHTWGFTSIVQPTISTSFQIVMGRNILIDILHLKRTQALFSFLLQHQL